MSQAIDYVRRLLYNFGWADAVELVLIGGIVYLIYRSLRGTRGARLVRGFIVLAVILFIGIRLFSAWFELGRLEHLYKTAIPWVVVFTVIVFQPELRRSLMRLGQNPFFRLFLKEGETAFVDRLVRAATTLGRNKIGAIVAIERDARLGGFIESGTLLDADLTSELLVTIFWPGSPLHDMGVVIRSGRIAAAGVEFPLSRQAILDPSLGTRHRAAVGLTEETDAVVIVVSEETGKVSLAVYGRLERNLTADQLRQRLTELLRGTEATLTEHSLQAAETVTQEKQAKEKLARPKDQAAP